MRNLLLIFFITCVYLCNAQTKYTNAQLDSLGKNVPAEYEESIDKLANYFQSLSNNKSEQSRLVYSWVAHHILYDDVAFNTQVYSDPNAESVFKSRKAVCAGYSSVFKALCDAMNLPCIAIDGFAKGYGFQTGMPVNGTNHSWNAVKYNDQWHLMDATWGSGYAENINGKAKSKSVFSTYWFDVPAREFIFNHFPDSSQYQFLSKKITREQFKKQIYFDANVVFQLGFNVDSILIKSQADPKFRLPDVYNFEKSSFKIKSVPYDKIIKATSSYYFEIEQLSTDTIVLLNNKQLIQMDSKSDNIFYKMVVQPMRGELLIGILRGEAVEIIITYKVI
jgi:hypothetical protein